jgi:hypothetical protein
MNIFEGKSQAWLLERRSALQDILAGDGGSQTHVGIAPGIFDEFDKLTEAQLIERLRKINYALYVIDPDLYDNPNASKVLKVQTVYC